MYTHTVQIDMYNHRYDAANDINPLFDRTRINLVPSEGTYYAELCLHARLLLCAPS